MMTARLARANAETWVWLTLAVGTLIGLVTGVGTYRAAPGGSAWASGLTAGLLAATFLAILWYSWETRRLVDAQQEASEIARHPWLSATALKLQRVTLAGAFDLWLPIHNNGTTPAYIARIRVDGTPEPLFDARDPVSDEVIVPGDVLHLRLGTVSALVYEAAQPRVEVTVRMRYRTADGGLGALTVGFEHVKGDWLNLDTDYRFTLSTGKAFPAVGGDGS